MALFAGAPLPVFQAATEMQPFLRPFGRWSLDYAQAYFGPALWLLAPIAWLFASGSKSSSRRLVLIWAGVTAALALWQTRYAHHFAFPAALLLGFGADWAVRRLGSKGVPRIQAWGLTAGASLLLLRPALTNSAGLALSNPQELTADADLIETCDWLRARTPATRSLWREEGAPEYGVYAMHDLGGPIAAIAQRPAAAANMHVMREHILDSSAFFFMDSAEQAYAFLRERGFRYLVLNDIVHNGVLPMEAGRLHVPGLEAGPSEGGLALAPHFWDLVYLRLYVHDGALDKHGAKPVAPVGHMRLVHEGPTQSSGVRRFKVFEVVAGVEVKGRCAAGVVEASVPVRTDQGRDFIYRTFAPCEGRGFSLNLPYAGSYSIVSARGRKSLAVSEDEVSAGIKRALSFE